MFVRKYKIMNYPIYREMWIRLQLQKASAKNSGNCRHLCGACKYKTECYSEFIYSLYPIFSIHYGVSEKKFISMVDKFIQTLYN